MATLPSRVLLLFKLCTSPSCSPMPSASLTSVLGFCWNTVFTRVGAALFINEFLAFAFSQSLRSAIDEGRYGSWRGRDNVLAQELELWARCFPHSESSLNHYFGSGRVLGPHYYGRSCCWGQRLTVFLLWQKADTGAILINSAGIAGVNRIPLLHTRSKCQLPHCSLQAVNEDT